MKKSDYFERAEEGYGPAVMLVPDTCLFNAEDDEPIFVLRAKDPIAADIVDIWATLAVKHHDFEKMQSAQKIAHQMRVWMVARMERELAK